MAIDTDLRNSIVDAYSANLNYTKPLLINLGTSSLDISSAVGSNPSTPKGATDQPLSFPPGSVYRFPKQYTGKESWKSLFESLRKCCADCKLTTHRKHQQKKKTAHLAYDIRCSCYFLNQNDKSQFSDRCFTKDNTRIVRNKKTNSNHSISVVDRMSNSKLRGKNVEKASRSNKKAPPLPLRNRSRSERPSTGEMRCHMRLKILLSSLDNRFYLMSDSNLSHTHHHPIIPEAKVLNQKDISKDEESWIQQMYKMGLSNGTIAAIMTGYFNQTGRDGQFSSNGIKHIINKQQQLEQLISGIDPDWSVAQKTIAKLNE